MSEKKTGQRFAVNTPKILPSDNLYGTGVTIKLGGVPKYGPRPKGQRKVEVVRQKKRLERPDVWVGHWNDPILFHFTQARIADAGSIPAWVRP